MKADQKQFDKSLEKIGSLYEEGKDCLYFIQSDEWNESELGKWKRLFKIVAELRNIGAEALKGNHEINPS